MTNTIIGIDPGITGAIAVISPSRIKLIDCPYTEIEVKVKPRKKKVDVLADDSDDPIVEIKPKSKTKPKTKIEKKLNPTLMAMEIAQFANSGAVVIVEKVHSMPDQGVASTFDFGQNYGIWLGAIAALNIPMELVTPQEWKKHYGLIGKPKDASRIIALQLFPQMAVELKLKKYNGRAEALLLAEYLRRKTGS